MSVISPYEVKEAIGKVKNDFPFLSRVPTSLVMGMCEVESSFNPNAIGSVGEIGLMQVKPTTANWILDLYHIKGYPGALNEINNQLLSGMCFLNWLMDKDISYLGVIHSYNVGLAGHTKYGKSNWTYVSRVLERQLRWTV